MRGRRVDGQTEDITTKDPATESAQTTRNMISRLCIRVGLKVQYIFLKVRTSETNVLLSHGGGWGLPVERAAALALCHSSFVSIGRRHGPIS